VSFEQSVLNIKEALKPVDDLCYQCKKKYLRLTVYAFYPLLLYVLRFLPVPVEHMKTNSSLLQR